MLSPIPCILLGAGALLSGLSTARADQPAYEEVDQLKADLEPVGDLVNCGDGYLYGVSIGASPDYRATIYRVAPHQPAEILHTFENMVTSIDRNYGGSAPSTGLVIGPDGAFYGATEYGGAYGYGVIYRITREGAFSVLHDCDSVDGMTVASLISVPDGYLYGTCYAGGAHSEGAIFRISLDGVYEGLYDFLPRGEGAVAEPGNPIELVLGRDGKIYGNTATGGPVHIFGLSFRFTYGTFYRYEGNGQITVLSDFFDQKKPPMRCAAADDGFYVVSDRHLMHLGFDGTKTVLADFLTDGKTDSALPADLINTPEGVYGVTFYGGSSGSGFFYRYTPGEGMSYLHDFSSAFEYRNKVMALGNDGLIYGVAAALKQNGKPVSRSFRFRDAAQTPGNFEPLADFDTGFLAVKANDQGQRELSVDVLANDSDPDDDTVTLTGVGSVAAGTISIVESHNRKRLLYTTAEVDPPSRRVSYTIADGKGGTATGTLAILSPANGEYAGEALSADAAPGQLSVVVNKKNSLHATFTLGELTYTGGAAFDADDTVELVLKAGNQSTAVLRLAVERGASRQLGASLMVNGTRYSATCVTE